jgi:hypothetical protein
VSLANQFRDDDREALREARGKHFQRLEFLGDAIIDVLAIRHEAMWRLSGAVPTCCEHFWFSPTDKALGVIAHERDLVSIAIHPVGSERSADLVEALVGAAYCVGGWTAASTFVSEHVHSIDREPTAPLVEFAGRAVYELGAFIFDAYCADSLFNALPDADEHELSDARAALMTNERRAKVARELELPQPFYDTAPAWADQLDFALGSLCIKDGIAAAIDASRAAAALL